MGKNYNIKYEAMMNTDKSPSILPLRPPVSLKVVALFFLLAGLFVSPELLMYLGPLRGSLTHSKQLVRDTTVIEIMVFRLTSISFSILILIIILAWRRLVQSRFVIQISKYQIIEPAGQKSQTSPFNFSFVVIMSFVLIGLLYAALGDQFFQPSTIYNVINGEDRLIEYSTAFIFLACSILSARMAVKVRDNWSRQIFYIVFAAGFFLCFGEEISWGQRIFNFETIGFMKDINAQGETNIHNLYGYFLDRVFFAGVFLYCVIFPYLKRSHRFWHQLFDKIGLVLPSLGLAIGFLVVSLVHNWTVYHVLPRSVDLSMRELREFLTSVGFLLFMYECWLSVRGDRNSHWAEWKQGHRLEIENVKGS